MTADWVGQHLVEIHRYIRIHFPGVERLAFALYEPKTDKLGMFVHSAEGENPLRRHQARLADVPSLVELARSGGDRLIGDLSALPDPQHEHTRLLLEAGYRSSYTMSVRADGELFGFLFFDSRQRQYFTTAIVERLAVFGHLLALILIHSVTPVRMLRSTLRVTSALTHYRDPETGGHLNRMAHYAWLIARVLAETERLSDEFVEFLFLFAPAHDIGKIAVPDHILLKPGRLTEAEFAVMKGHVTKGVEIIDAIVRELGLQAFPNVGILRNVVLSHHEAIDGSGYPQGLAGSRIPLEARIIAVADVFDALTSERPYKAAWSRETALRYLGAGAGSKFDAACVSVLTTHLREVEEIGRGFPDAESAAYQSREGYTVDL